MGWWSDPDTKHAFYLSWISVIVTMIACGSGIFIYTITGSSLMLSFGLENGVDFLSSCVVLWRFYCPNKLDEEKELLLSKREKRASMAISFILLFLGFGIIIAAAEDFSHGAENIEEYKIIVAVSFVSILIFGLLTVIKFHYSVCLQSASLHKDGICSLIGTIMATTLFINTIIIDRIPSVWWLDPAVAMGCGIASMGIGFHAIFVARFVQHIPIFQCHWWFVSQGDGKDELTGRPLGDEDLHPDNIINKEQQMTNVESNAKDHQSDTNEETPLEDVEDAIV